MTRTAFLSELARRGYARSPRWHESWIELGLLARGTPAGRKGGGVSYTWPAVQVEHACALLKKADESVALGALTKYVVWTWLWWGDDWLPFSQVPRAMRTWAKAERNGAMVHIRESAIEFANSFAHKHGTGKRRLVRALAQFPANGDPETLRDALQSVMDPERLGQPRGPAGAAVTVDGFLRLISARQVAVSNLAKYREAHYRAAANLYRRERVEYATLVTTFALDKDLGKLHRQMTLGELADTACVDLLTCLAICFERSMR